MWNLSKNGFDVPKLNVSGSDVATFIKTDWHVANLDQRSFDVPNINESGCNVIKLNKKRLRCGEP